MFVYYIKTNVMSRHVKELKEQINAVLFDTLRRIGLGSSRVAKSVRIELDDSIDFKLIFNDYVHYIDSGRRPRSTPPPIQPILDFISRKGITATHLTSLQLAYAISRSIGIKGIKERPFLDKLHEEITGLFEIHLFEETSRILMEELNLTIE